MGTRSYPLAPGRGGDKPEDHTPGRDGSAPCEPRPLGPLWGALDSPRLASPGRPSLSPERAGDSGPGTLLRRKGPWGPRCGDPTLLPSIRCQPSGGHCRAQISPAFVLGSPRAWWAPGLCWCRRSDLPKVTLPDGRAGTEGPVLSPDFSGETPLRERPPALRSAASGVLRCFPRRGPLGSRQAPGPRCAWSCSAARLPSSLGVHARVTRRTGEGWPARHGPPTPNGLGSRRGEGRPRVLPTPGRGSRPGARPAAPWRELDPPALPSALTWSPLMRGPGAGHAGQ